MKKPSNENINCQKYVKNINNRRKMHQNRKKYSKTLQNSLKKHQKQPKTHEKKSKIRLKTSRTVEIASKAT